MTYESENAIAVRVEILYLLNLLIIPGIAFVLMYKLYKEHKGTTNALTRSHISQAIVASIVVGVLIIGFTVLMFIFGSTNDPYTWMWIILYFTCFHASFILLGVFSLIKAMANQIYRYPVIGNFAERLKGYERTS